MTALFPDDPRPAGPYTFAWALHPSVLIGTGLLGALYFYGIGPYRRRHNLGPPASPWQIASFCAGILVFNGVLNGPLHDLSDYYLFSAHMIQHLVLMLVFPPLIIAGTPGWLLRPFFRRPGVLPVARGLTHPVAAAIIYTATVALWHLPAYYDVVMENHDIHIVSHLMFIGAATLMWWVVMSPSEEVPPLSPGIGMLYLFLIGIPMQLIAALITLSGEVLYPWYAIAPRTWGLSPLDDQRLGGLLMWIPGNLWMFLAIGVLFFRWAKEDEKPVRAV